jgi:hypothetical protein
VNVTGKLFGIFIGIDEYCFVTALEEMPGPFPFYVEVVGVCPVYVLHYLRKIP